MKKKKKRTAPFLGAFKLNWCLNCNLPILDKKTCELCKKPTKKVFIAPPGDVRPAFKDDIKRIAKIIDTSYGKGSAKALGLTTKRLVLLNESSFYDLMDEIIIDGQVMGSIRYNLSLERWDFYPRLIGAQRIFENRKFKKRYIIMDKDAVKYIADGYNVLSPGIEKLDSDLRIDDSAVVLSPDGKVLSTGTMKINGKAFDRSKKGVVLKPKHFIRNTKEEPIGNIKAKNQTWEQAVKVNNSTLDYYEEGALRGIMVTRNKYPLMPLSVSFSGGKDSLVCLQLARKIPNLDYKIIFVNTSLEFPETIDYIENLVDELKLRNNYCRKDIPENIFWNSIRNYGPPGKDYRYCCKLLKIGPVNDLISECIGKRSLSLIGQRAYESIARSKSKRLWENPWIPNQLNFSPIQKWTALHIWLYIFREKVPYNPLYEKGFSRIGCWLCPASNQGTFEIIKEVKPKLWQKWQSFLIEWQERNNLPKQWISWGLWRWKKLPKKILDLADRRGIILDYEKKEEKSLGDWDLTFSLHEGFVTCKTGELILDGSFSQPINLERLIPFWQIFGRTDFDEELGLLVAKTANGTTVTISADGAINAKGKTIESTKTILKKLVLEVLRAEDCNGCQVCVTHCKTNALKLNTKTNQIELNNNLCSKCFECHNRCPVIRFGHREIEELFSDENNSS